MEKTLEKNRKINGFKFELSEDKLYYECRGATYFDEEHDQVPEPALQVAADKLAKLLKEEGNSPDIDWGEKGWIEVWI